MPAGTGGWSAPAGEAEPRSDGRRSTRGAGPVKGWGAVRRIDELAVESDPPLRGPGHRVTHEAMVLGTADEQSELLAESGEGERSEHL